MSGKGSKQRPTNHEQFVNNYEAIFGRKNRVALEVQAEKSNTPDTWNGKDYDMVVVDELAAVWPFPLGQRP